MKAHGSQNIVRRAWIIIKAEGFRSLLEQAIDRLLAALPANFAVGFSSVEDMVGWLGKHNNTGYYGSYRVHAVFGAASLVSMGIAPQTKKSQAAKEAVEKSD